LTENQLTDDRKDAVVHACDLCTWSEGWDLARPLEEVEMGTGTPADLVVGSPSTGELGQGLEEYGRIFGGNPNPQDSAPTRWGLSRPQQTDAMCLERL
jgi:hypothetical protein